MKFSLKSQALAYSLPAIPMALPTLPVFVLLPTFYFETVGMTLAQIGFMLLLARLADGVSDVIAARWCDQSFPYIPASVGVRKSWILAGSALAAPGLVLLFNPPDSAGPLWLLTSASLLFLGWTLINIPYQSWITELTKDYDTRTSLTTKREAMGLIGLVLSAALPATLMAVGLSQANAFTVLSLVTLFVAALLFRLFWTLPDNGQPEKLSWQWRSVIKLPGFMRLNLAWLTNNLANGMAAVLFPMVVTTGFDGTDTQRALFLLVYFLSAILGLPLIRKFSEGKEKHKVWAMVMVFSLPAFAMVPFLGPEHSHWYLVICILTGFSLGADQAMPPSIQADLADYDEHLNGDHRPSLFYAIQNLTLKIALGLAAAIAGWAVTFGSQMQGLPAGETDRLALLVIYAWPAIVLKLIACSLIWSFPVKRPPGRSHSEPSGIEI